MHLLMKKLPTETKLCCKIIGTDVAISDLSNCLSKSFGFWALYIARIFLKRTIAVKTHDIAYDIKVAHAAPAMSQ